MKSVKALVNRIALFIAVATVLIYLVLASDGLSNIDINSQAPTMIANVLEAETLFFSLILIALAIISPPNVLGVLDEYRTYICIGALVGGWMALGIVLAEFRKVW